MPQLDTRPVVLITGAAGNLGCSLGEALARDYRIVGLDRSAEGAMFKVFEADFNADALVDAGAAQVPGCVPLAHCQRDLPGGVFSIPPAKTACFTSRSMSRAPAAC